MKHATRIKQLCKKYGKSVAEIERLAGIPAKSISGWDKSNPSSDKVDRVIKALGITRDEYFDGEDNPNKPIRLNVTKGAFANLMFTMIEENLKSVLPTDEEFQLLALYRLASDRDKKIIQSILDTYKEEEDASEEEK